jgi:hypothetical protein
MSRWTLTYSLQRDGASLQRFYDLTEHMPALVLIVQDDRGKVIIFHLSYIRATIG